MTAFQFARRHAVLIARIGGGLLVLVGILEVSGAWTAAIDWLKIALAGQLPVAPLAAHDDEEACWGCGPGGATP